MGVQFNVARLEVMLFVNNPVGTGQEEQEITETVVGAEEAEHP